MMAGVVVSIVWEEILRKLNSIAAQDISSASSLQCEVQKLRKSLSSVQAVLQDAEMRQGKDKSVRVWLKKLKYGAYYADDVLDEIATELPRWKTEMNKVCNFFLPLSPNAFPTKLAHKIKDVNKRLDEIIKEMYSFQFREGGAVSTTSLKSSREDQETHPIDVHYYSEIWGRDIDKDAVKNYLLCLEHTEGISFISIVGERGSGKTSLARSVYNESWVNSHYDIKTWVTVSDDFDVKRVMREILESATGTPCHLFNIDAIIKVLGDKLKKKKLLLVLDDVRSEDSAIAKWEFLETSLRKCFPCEDPVACKILVTTSNNTVADVIGKHFKCRFTHRLETLSDNDSWSIFREQAFTKEEIEQEANPNLVKIGKEIVRKCKGLPLEVKMLGSLMRSKREENQWLSVRDSAIWDLPEDQNGKILPALRLNYEHLSSHLKQCFAHCSIFPKDYKIRKDTVIQLWMAQGLVQLQPSQSPEDIAHDYFNILLSTLYFEETEEDKYGDLIACKMPELVYDLAQFVNENECSVIQADDVKRVDDRTRHVSFADYNVKEKTYQSALRIIKESSLHTFLMLRSSYYLTPSHEKVLSFKCLRVLDLSLFDTLDKLSPSIGKLIHLRYLDLSFTDIKLLPNSITNLYNLHTLKLINCWNILELPKGITKMINLRHLEINTTDISIPKDIGKLTNLQTLHKFKVHKDSQCGIGELGCLQYLRGNLEILFLENLRDEEEASKAKLKEKKNLRRLRLWWSMKEVNTNADDVMKGLHPPQDLKVLEIFYFPGERIPSWMTDGGDGDFKQQQQQLPSLEFLRIKSCINLQSLSNMGGFRSLKFLIISDCGKLTSLPEKGLINLVSLSSLSIQNCPKLTSLPAEIQGLQELDIFGCPILCTRCEIDKGEDWLKISNIPRIMLDGFSVKKSEEAIFVGWVKDRLARIRMLKEAVDHGGFKSQVVIGDELPNNLDQQTSKVLNTSIHAISRMRWQKQ